MHVQKQQGRKAGQREAKNMMFQIAMQQDHNKEQILDVLRI